MSGGLDSQHAGATKQQDSQLVSECEPKMLKQTDAAANAFPPKAPLWLRETELPPATVRALELWKPESNWELQSQDKDTGGKLFTRASPYCTPKAVWASVPICCPNLKCEDFISLLSQDADPANPNAPELTYDKEYIDKRVLLKRISDTESVWLKTYKTPVFFIAPRDICLHLWSHVWISPKQQLQYNLHSETGRVFCLSGYDASGEFPPDPKSKCQRCIVHVYMLLVEELRDGLKLHLVYSADPSGNVPATFIDMSSSGQLIKVKLIREMLLAAKKKETTK